MNDVSKADKPRMTAVDPATGEAGRTYVGHTLAEAQAITARTRTAYEHWRGKSFAERAPLMKKAAEVLRRRAEEFAALMTVEMGKTRTEGLAEIEKCAFNCDHYAEAAATYLAPRPIDIGGPKTYVTYNPLGVVLAVMPWNFPFWQVFRFAAPTLMAGNGAVLKHASNVPGCALDIEAVWREAGLPDGLFATLLVGSPQVERLIAHESVAAVTLTGSVEAGRSVAKHAGEHLKKTVLELGGSDPYVILEDADLERAADVCVQSRLINSGQSCIAAKRFIVVDAVRERFEALFTERMARAKVGDPRAEDTDVGPLARTDLRDAVHRAVEESVAKGARLRCGGEVPRRPGAWYPPTVLTDVRKGMPAADDEVFGPVGAILPAKDEAEAIAIANDSVFGLGAAVFTRDRARGERIARESLNAGCCFVNDFVRSDPRLPFGGVKESGYGRELGVFGIREFVNVKTVCVR
jgi:succinate-semialdehyde dehydrogenase/glutarate-semialdehyde dehydrogenase